MANWFEPDEEFVVPDTAIVDGDGDKVAILRIEDQSSNPEVARAVQGTEPGEAVLIQGQGAKGACSVKFLVFNEDDVAGPPYTAEVIAGAGVAMGQELTDLGSPRKRVMPEPTPPEV